MKISKTTKKYLDIINSGTFTEQQIISIRKYLGSSGTCSKEERELILKEFHKKPLKITHEQSEKGIKWMVKHAFKKNGELRQAKGMCLGEREAFVLRNFRKFELVGLIDYRDLPSCPNPTSMYLSYLPLYKVIAYGGETFEYTSNMGFIEVTG